MTEKFKFLFLILQLITSVCFSQKLEFEHISNNEGLVSSKVTSVCKDYQGYMWMGTFDGLSRYDGYTFSNYINNPSDTTTITDNYIRCLLETKNRDLIIGLQFNGICLFNRASETFTRFTHHDKDTNSLIHNFVFSVYEDRNGNVWVCTRGGLDLFDIKAKKFIHYKAFPHGDYAVSGITEDESGNLWLFGKNKEICKFNPQKNHFEYIDLEKELKVAKIFYRGSVLKYDSRKNLWIGSENGGLYRYSPSTGNIVSYTVENNMLRSNLIFSISEDSKKDIWIGTDGAGVYRYNYQKDTLENYCHDPGDASSLSGNGIYCVYESDPGVIWIGVYAAGVNVYKRDKRKFYSFSAIGKEHERLSQKSVLSMVEGKQGYLWLGTDGGGLNLLNRNTGQFTYYTKENSIVHSNIIKCMAKDEDGSFWLGSYGNGLAKINFDTGKDTIFNAGKNNSNQIINDNIWSLCNIDSNQIWVGLLGYGTQLYEKKSHQFIHYSFDTLASRRAVCDVFVIRRDHANRVWIGTEEAGLGYYDPVTKTIRKFIHNPHNKNSLSDNDIGDIYEDSRHQIWIGTMWGGLNKIVDLDKGIFKAYTKKDGLPSNNVRGILEDSHGNLWISTDNGISMFKVAENKFINFGREDGLINREFNYNSKLKAKDGYLFFGGIEGLTMFHPDSLKFNNRAPKIVITDFKIFNKSIKANRSYDGKTYLNKSITLTKEIILTNEDYVFSIEFAALDFISPGNNKYAYQLEGFDNKWTTVNADKRFATYTNLDPGVYTFKVIACNNDGVWNKEGIALTITILPPWWKTIWFRFCIIILFIIIVVGYYYIRLKSIEERNRLLSEEVVKRTAELKEANEGLQERNVEILLQKEEITLQKDELEKKKYELEYVNKTKDKFFSILGHDLKGPVTALTFLTEMLKSEWKSLDESMRVDYVTHIDKSSQQIKNLVLNLLEWARSQSGQVKLDPVAFPVQKVFDENVELLLQQANQKQITLQVETNADHFIYGDYNMICTVVRNILSNSIKYTPRGGQIHLSSIWNGNGTTRIRIKDSGVGMEKAILEKLFSIDKGPSVKGTEKETGTGLGLVISHEFTLLNKGHLYAESIVGQGSSFYIELPSMSAEVAR